MNARQRRVSKREADRFAASPSGAALIKTLDGFEHHVKSLRNELQYERLQKMFPVLEAMQEGNQVWVRREAPEDRVLVGSCDSLTDSLRGMKSTDTQRLRLVFDTATNTVEVTDIATGAKSTHVVTNLTEAAKKAIMSPGLGIPSMGCKL